MKNAHTHLLILRMQMTYTMKNSCWYSPLMRGSVVITHAPVIATSASRASSNLHAHARLVKMHTNAHSKNRAIPSLFAHIVHINKQTAPSFSTKHHLRGFVAILHRV